MPVAEHQFVRSLAAIAAVQQRSPVTAVARIRYPQLRIPVAQQVVDVLSLLVPRQKQKSSSFLTAVAAFHRQPNRCKLARYRQFRW